MAYLSPRLFRGSRLHCPCRVSLYQPHTLRLDAFRRYNSVPISSMQRDFSTRVLFRANQNDGPTLANAGRAEPRRANPADCTAQHSPVSATTYQCDHLGLVAFRRYPSAQYPPRQYGLTHLPSTCRVRSLLFGPLHIRLPVLRQHCSALLTPPDQPCYHASDRDSRLGQKGVGDRPPAAALPRAGGLFGFVDMQYAKSLTGGQVKRLICWLMGHEWQPDGRASGIVMVLESCRRCGAGVIAFTLVAPTELTPDDYREQLQQEIAARVN